MRNLEEVGPIIGTIKETSIQYWKAKAFIASFIIVFFSSIALYVLDEIGAISYRTREIWEVYLFDGVFPAFCAGVFFHAWLEKRGAEMRIRDLYEEGLNKSVFELYDAGNSLHKIMRLLPQYDSVSIEKIFSELEEKKRNRVIAYKEQHLSVSSALVE